MLKLEHANLSVTDVDSVTRFLTSAFPQFRIRGQGLDSQGRRWRHVGTDDFYLALQAVPETTARELYGNSTGLNHLGWEVDDLDALEQRLAAAGFEANTRDNEHPARRRSYFFDPEGNDWEFVEYRTGDPAERHRYE